MIDECGITTTEMPEILITQDLHKLASPFTRDKMMGYTINHLGGIDRDEIATFAQCLYEDAIAGNSRPISIVLAAAGLTRESDQLRYGRTALGRLDAALINSTHSEEGHNFLMSHVVLGYSQAEMEEKRDSRPWQPGTPVRSAIYRLAGDGPIRPLMLSIYRLESIGAVTIQKSNDREVIKPTSLMDEWADILEELVQPLRSQNILLVAGTSGVRVLDSTVI